MYQEAEWQTPEGREKKNHRSDTGTTAQMEQALHSGHHIWFSAARL